MRDQHSPFPDTRGPKAASKDAELRLFISYSHFDADLLVDRITGEPTEFLRIMKGLQTDNIHVEFDRSLLKAGDLWNRKIRAELRICDILVPILSDDFMQSEYCNRVEISTLLARKRNDHDVMITPFYYKYCDWNQAKWIKQRDIRPRYNEPFQAIQGNDERTKALIQFRSELRAQASLLKREIVK
jgi:hypothetical protein